MLAASLWVSLAVHTGPGNGDKPAPLARVRDPLCLAAGRAQNIIAVPPVAWAEDIVVLDRTQSRIDGAELPPSLARNDTESCLGSPSQSQLER